MTAGDTTASTTIGNPNPLAEIELNMPPHVRQAVHALGRTEDIRFSPDNTLAVLAGFAKNSCLLLDMRIDGNIKRPTVSFDAFLELKSPAISQPHGFDFIGNDRIVVGNRNSAITVFRLPRRHFLNKSVTMEPERTIRRTGLFHKLGTPGSICVVQKAGAAVEILACNTYRNKVSSHRYTSNPFMDLFHSRVLLKNGLNIPDGIAVSPDRRFIAVSNHNHHCVSMFDRSAGLGPKIRPMAKLTGVAYPHGLRFSPDGRFLYVADAGQPLVHQFASAGGNWNGEQAPARSAAVLSREEFAAGRFNDTEGGPKGLDIDSTGTILAVTCEARPLALFNIAALFSNQTAHNTALSQKDQS